jgi:hypothetical protein
MDVKYENRSAQPSQFGDRGCLLSPATLLIGLYTGSPSRSLFHSYDGHPPPPASLDPQRNFWSTRARLTANVP